MKRRPSLLWTLSGVLLTAAIGFPLHWATGLAPHWAYAVAISFATLLLYRIDKWLSPRGDVPRIPNLLLVFLALVGGSAGAIFGVAAGHKTSRRYLWLRMLLWVLLIGQLTAAYFAFVGSTAPCRRILGQLLA